MSIWFLLLEAYGAVLVIATELFHFFQLIIKIFSTTFVWYKWGLRIMDGIHITQSLNLASYINNQPYIYQKE